MKSNSLSRSTTQIKKDVIHSWMRKPSFPVLLQKAACLFQLWSHSCSQSWEVGNWAVWLKVSPFVQSCGTGNTGALSALLHHLLHYQVSSVVNSSQALCGVSFFLPLFLSFRCAQSSHECLVLFLCRLVLAGEKPGTEQDEVKLQNASKQIVQTAILRAVQQVSQESQQQEKRTNSSASLQLERGKLTKKHEKK